MTQEAARTHCNRCTSHGLVIRASNSGVIPENVWRNQLPPHFTQPVAIPKTLEQMATRATKTSAKLPVKPNAA